MTQLGGTCKEIDTIWGRDQEETTACLLWAARAPPGGAECHLYSRAHRAQTPRGGGVRDVR